MERLNEHRISRRVLIAEVSDGRARGRPRLRCVHFINVALSTRGMTGSLGEIDRKEWREMIEFHTSISASPCVLSDRFILQSE